MYGQPSTKKMIMISQASIMAFSFISVFLRQYFWLIIILYMFLLMGITSYTTMRKTKPKPEDLKSLLFKEPNAMKIAMTDKLLNKELMKQMKGMMLGFATLPIALVIFSIYPSLIAPYVSELIDKITEDPILVSFLNFFIMYEVVFSAITVIRILLLNRFTFENIMLPQKFAVYKKGVLSNERMFVRFEEGQCFKYNPKRKFIEIINPKVKGFRLRLYSERISELRDRLLNTGVIKECEE